MSIYGTTLMLGENEHEDGCAIYVEDPPGSDCYEFSGKPCDCGTPRAPIVYEGSHVLPSDEDRRGGLVDLASIPDFIERDGRDDGHGVEGVPNPWLRLAVRSCPSTERYEGKPYVAGGDATVVLDRPLVQALYDSLGLWLQDHPEAA